MEGEGGCRRGEMEGDRGEGGDMEVRWRAIEVREVREGREGMEVRERRERWIGDEWRSVYVYMHMYCTYVHTFSTYIHMYVCVLRVLEALDGQAAQANGLLCDENDWIKAEVR